MVNEELKAKLAAKIEDGDFGPDDLTEYITLFCEVCNESEDIQEEAKGVNLKFQFVLEEGDSFWLQVAGGKFSWGTGTTDGPDNTLKASLSDGVKIIIGEKDATGAYQSGALKIEGELPNAVKLRTFIEIVRDEIED